MNNPMPDQLDANELMKLAATHHQTGRLKEAASLYERILTAYPDYLPALQYAGILDLQLGQVAAGIYHLERAAAINGADAMSAYYLGLAYEMAGQTAIAENWLRRAIVASPDHVDSWVGLGCLLRDSGRYVEAIHSFENALKRQGNHFEALRNLGIALLEKGDPDKALTTLVQALEIVPNNATLYNNIGSALLDLDRCMEAEAYFQKAVELDPQNALAWFNGGVTAEALGNIRGGIERYQKAILVNANLVVAYSHLANSLIQIGEYGEAERVLETALGLDPAHSELNVVLGNLQLMVGRTEESITSYRRALERKNIAAIHSNIIFAQQHLTNISAAEQFAEQVRFGESFESPLKVFWSPHTNSLSRDRPLRVGYVSGDFRSHSVANFIEPVLRNHDRTAFLLHAYHNSHLNDSTTQRLKQYFHKWTPVIKMSDEQMASAIRADQIDILVDLSGHTANNRLLVFAMKPAPIQISWIGYTGSTGLSAMDFRITDAIIDPPEKGDVFNTESLIRLPGLFYAFEPDPISPPVNALPALSGSGFTYAVMNGARKINRDAVKVWAKILLRAPDSKLLLTEMSSDEVRNRCQSWFADVGIDGNRLILIGRQPKEQFMRLHHRVDFALDTFPFSGGTTTCHGLWMGVPTVTMPQHSSISRQSAAILVSAGLDEFVAKSADDYIEIAVTQSKNLEYLSHLRQTMRQRTTVCSPVHAERTTRYVEAAFLQAWRNWVDGKR